MREIKDELLVYDEDGKIIDTPKEKLTIDDLNAPNGDIR